MMSADALAFDFPEEVSFVRNERCNSCGSKDGLSRYSDGSGYCDCGFCDFSAAASEQQGKEVSSGGLIRGDFRALEKRRISQETCRRFGWRVGQYLGQTVGFAEYRNAKGSIVAQRVRVSDEKYEALGELPEDALFGSHLWSTGKMIVVADNELNAMSVSECQSGKYPVVSIPGSASDAKRFLQKSLPYLEGFESVVLMFRSDEAGQQAAMDAAMLFTPGRCKVASLPLIDPSACLVEGRKQDVISAIWNAKVARPDGIINGADLWSVVSVEDAVASIALPWDALNEVTRGLRQGELVTITAGSGVGKSSVLRELAYYLIQQGENVGMLMLEESTKRTAMGMMGVHLSKPIHISRQGVSQEQLKGAFDATLGSGRCWLYDHFGSTSIENLLSRVRYLAKGCGCKWIFLDHLSIVVSGLGDGDERRLIDNAMTALRTLVQETGIGLILVVHLRRPEGEKGYEQGREVTLNALRGSHSIAQLSDAVWGLERDQQGEDKNVTSIRVLKNRFTGETGPAGKLYYNSLTGRLSDSRWGGFEEDMKRVDEGEFEDCELPF